MPNNPKLKIDGIEIGKGFPPYIIAELSANHNGRIENAIQLIKEAKLAGASAVKLQTYTADTITLDSEDEDFQIQGGLWSGRSLYSLYQEAHMPWEWHEELFHYARSIGISIFSSPFDSSAVDMLEDLNTPAYKIASFEAIDLPLIKYVASTKKPMIISTGMADAEEIAEAIDTAKTSGCESLAILHCVSGYPAPAEDYNLKTIPDMMAKFNLVTGLSDHTIDNSTAIAAVALGASLVEKHFTLDRNGGGPDDSFSLEPKELRALCESTSNAWSALGNADYGRKSSEIGNAKFRRSLYFVKDIKAGSVIGADAVRSVRPGYGLPPRDLDRVIGSVATQDIRRNTKVTEDSFE